jgi:hypothetical protein
MALISCGSTHQITSRPVQSKRTYIKMSDDYKDEAMNAATCIAIGSINPFKLTGSVIGLATTSVMELPSYPDEDIETYTSEGSFIKINRNINHNRELVDRLAMSQEIGLNFVLRTLLFGCFIVVSPIFVYNNIVSFILGEPTLDFGEAVKIIWSQEF